LGGEEHTRKLIVVVVLSLLLTGFFTAVFDFHNVCASDPGYVEFNDLSYHGLDNLFSSLNVSGTVDVYDDYNLSLSANTTTFTNTSIANLAYSSRGASGNWDNAIKSLKVNGTVTFYERPDFLGKAATFTSDQSSDISGFEWNANPNLNQTEGSWDSRIWNASLDALQIPSENDRNAVLWKSNGHVESYAQDNASDPWKIVNFDQGYERNENEIPNLADWNAWDNKAKSLIVEGSVTAFNGTNFAGENRTFSSSVPDLAIDGWNDTISSLKLAQGSRITLFENTNFTGRSKSFVSPTYQPAELKVSDTNTITLEGLIHDWYTDSWSWTTWGWTGAKFEVTASENRSSSSDKVLKIGMYFLRGGANLAWQWWDLTHAANALVNWQGTDKECYYNVGNTYNYMIALDAFPDFAQRTVYLGDVAKWRVDVKALVQKACYHWSSALDINKLNITKLSYALEAAHNLEDFDPKINCSLSQLRLTYTPAPSTRVYIEPYALQNEALVPGTTFNVSVKIANIPANPGLVGIAFKLSWNSTLLNTVSMEDAIYHEVIPQAEIDNLWILKKTVATNFVDYAYTFQDLNRALAGGYAPINGSHTIAKITLKVMNIGKCVLHFDSVKLGDPHGNPIPYQLSDGSFDNLPPHKRAIISVEPARIANASLGPGSNIIIDIRITNASDVAVVEFKLDFNPAALEAFNVTSGGFIPPTVTPFIQLNSTGGYVILSLASQTALGGNGTMVTIELTVRQRGLLNSPLQLSHVRLTDNTDQELPFLKIDGSFSNIELVGDLNFDGTVDIFDAIMLAGSFGSTRGSPNYKPEADINNDGFVDIYDALLLAGNFGKTTH
jgi:hypothetical protein